MKKTLIAAAVMAASGVAFAASNVTLYGILDTGIGVSKVKHQDTTVQMTTGMDSGSRWGIKGVEDLGNGYSVGFVAEQGFNSDDGNVANGSYGTTSGFTREMQLNVKGAFGTLAAGRFGTLASGAGSYNILQGWAFGASYGDQGSWTRFGKAWARTNNTLVYVTPAFGGFTVSAMYSNGLSADTDKWSKNRHYYGLGLKYAGGPLNGSLIFEAVDGRGTAEEGKEGTLTNKYFANLGLGPVYDADQVKVEDKKDMTLDKQKTAYGITAGGSYDFGAAKLFAIYQYAWQKEMYNQHAFGLSVGVPVAGGEAKLGARYLIGKFDGEAKRNAKDFGLDDKYRAFNIDAGYTYPLSKRTKVYGFAGWSDGAKAYNNVEKGAWNGWTVAACLVHSF